MVPNALMDDTIRKSLIESETNGSVLSSVNDAPSGDISASSATEEEHTYNDAPLEPNAHSTGSVLDSAPAAEEHIYSQPAPISATNSATNLTTSSVENGSGSMVPLSTLWLSMTPMRLLEPTVPAMQMVFEGVYRFTAGSITIEAMLGKGAFGECYRGMQGVKVLALKEIDFNRAKEKLQLSVENLQEALQWEVACLSKIQHPNIVQFYGVYENLGKHYMVMEYCSSGTLEQILRKDLKTLSWQQRWQWALEMASGLTYLHQHGILHRDLKAENVLLDSHLCARLADLGVAQVDALLEKKEAYVVEKGLRDQRYIAPEILLKQPEIKASDIYGLGFLLWQLVTGQTPRRWSPALLEEARGQSEYEREPIPNDCPKAFKALILACWQWDPSKRPSAEEIVGFLHGCCTEFVAEPSLMLTAHKIEGLIYPKQSELLRYKTSYVTAHRVLESADAYWQVRECGTKTDEETKQQAETSLKSDSDNPPLELQKILQTFLESESKSLLVLGEGGLGKTLGLYQLASQLLANLRSYLADLKGKTTPWIPILLRPVLEGWFYGDLKDGFKKALLAYGIEFCKEIRYLVIVDAYDECVVNDKVQNLWETLGIDGLSNVKLLVTCRPSVVPEEDLSARFGLKNQLNIYYALPFAMMQVFEYLKETLVGSPKALEQYQLHVSSSVSLRTVFRNPFALSLFLKSWSGFEIDKLESLTRWKLYQGFVRYTITEGSRLLLDSVKKQLRESLNDLIESFEVFAGEVAWVAYQQGLLMLPMKLKSAVSTVSGMWLELSDLVLKESAEYYDSVHTKPDRRSLLSKAEYVSIMIDKLAYFKKDLPVQSKQRNIEFVHKSLFEFFGAQYLIRMALKSQTVGLKQTIALLNTRAIQTESGMLDFIVEGFAETQRSDLEKLFCAIVECSKTDSSCAMAAANAMTILNHANYVFSGCNFENIKIPGADLQGAILDRTNLRGADLRNVNLSGAWLYGAQLERSDLSGVSFGEEPNILLPSVPTQCVYDQTGRWLSILAGKALFVYEYEQRVLKPLLNHSSVLCMAFGSSGDLLYFAGQDGCVRSLNLKDFSLETIFSVAGPVRYLQFNAVAKHWIAGDEKNIWLFTQDWKEPRSLFEEDTLEDSEIKSLALSSNGQWLAVGDDQGIVRLWKATQIGYELYAQYRDHVSKNPKEELGFSVSRLVFSRGCDKLASCAQDGLICIREFRQEHWNKQGRFFRGHHGWVNALAFSTDGQILFSGGSDKTIRIWEVESGRTLSTLGGSSKNINAIAYHPQGHHMVSCSGGENWLRVWESPQLGLLRKAMRSSGLVYSVAISDDAHWVAAGTQNKSIMLLSVLGNVQKSLAGHTEAVRCVAFSQTAKQLVSGSVDKTVRVWDLEGESSLVLGSHHQTVNSVKFCVQDTQVVSAGDDYHIRVWDIKQKACIASFQCDDAVCTVAIHPLGVQFAMGGQGPRIQFWDREKSNEIKECALLVGQERVRGIQFNQDGCQLVSVSLEGNNTSLRVWDLNNIQPKIRFEQHFQDIWINSVVYHPVCKEVIILGDEANIRVWDMNRQEECLSLGVNSAVNSLCCRSNALNVMEQAFLLITGHEDTSVRGWKFIRKENAGKVEVTLQLLWSTYQAALMLQEANVQDAQNLSVANTLLLSQRGAVGAPKIGLGTQTGEEHKDQGLRY